MIRLYNTLTHSKKIFEPIAGKEVTMYSCGPTVYDHAHIGNLRAYIFADTLARVLRTVAGYQVKWVMNITDIDDKMLTRIARDTPELEPHLALGLLADKYTDAFLDDIEKIGIRRADIFKLPRATDHIAGMQELIKKLLREEIAYISQGSVYFSVEKYTQSGKKYPQLVSLEYSPQARVTDDQDQKEGMADFVLWKAKKPGEPSWNFEWLGENLAGRPGWHIECSVMSTQYLGQEFDIHTGGVDLKFPHHENEIAQCGGVQARFYLHNEHLRVENTKMSKSLNNFVTLEDIQEPLVFRLLCLQAHYRSQMEFSTKVLVAAAERFEKLRAYTQQLVLASAEQLDAAESVDVTAALNEFNTAIADDLNTPAALAALSSFEGKVYSQTAKNAMLYIDEILGLGLGNVPELDKAAADLVAEYTIARKQKSYVLSDKLRADLLNTYGVIVSDTPHGSLVHYK